MNIEDIELPDPTKYRWAFVNHSKGFNVMWSPIGSSPYITIHQGANGEEAQQLARALTARLMVLQRLIGTPVAKSWNVKRP